MKFSEVWLREWIDPKLDTKQLAEQLTMAGLEVDAVHPAAGEFSGVVVGHVVSAEQHPDADRLRCCKVDVGASTPLDIVCGGVNVRAGLKVAVATVGAVLPGDFKIKKTKLRGQSSEGMICSASELELAGANEEKGGILELADDAPVGTNLREYWQLDDVIIDIDLTPNRGDCLSLRGIARELSVLNKISTQAPLLEPVAATISDTFNVTVQDKAACPRYACRIIKGIQSGITSPIWLIEKLRRSGVRSIHPVVDICNYMMLELGQPMHAFDLAKLDGDIVVRQAKPDEQITLLDEQALTLHDPALLITDQNSPLAVAGVMGGADSAVTDETADILLESAFFNPVNVCLAARKYGLHTDSSYRFERGVDFELQVLAIERATQLITEIVGGEPGSVSEVVSESDLPQRQPIELEANSIERLLGMTFTPEEVTQVLESLGMQVCASNNGWRVTPPSWRFDMEQEADLIEELVRVHGYDDIPSAPMQADLMMPNVSEQRLTKSRIAKLLVDLGYHEAMTYSFISEQQQALLDPEHKPVALANPIASDMAVMRTSLWPGLLQALHYNLNRQVSRLKLFETGMCFIDDGKEWQQVVKLAMAAVGNAFPEQWGVKSRQVDFFDLKSDVEKILRLTRRSSDFHFEKVKNSVLHPGQSAVLYEKGQCIGYLGALHPKIAQHMGLNEVPLLFEIELQALETVQVPEFKTISKFPAVRRDLAIVIDEDVATNKILEQIASSCGQLLSHVQVFDVYQGSGIESGKKSVALGLTFQDATRTLIDEEINAIIQDVVAHLGQQLGATLRA